MTIFSGSESVISNAVNKQLAPWSDGGAFGKILFSFTIDTPICNKDGDR